MSTFAYKHYKLSKHTYIMVKTLRLLTLMLLVTLCTAVGAQTVVSFADGLPDDWTKTGTVANQTYAEKKCLQLQKAASITSPAMSGAYTKLNISLTRSGKGQNFTVAYKLGKAAAVDIKTFKSSDVAKNSWDTYTVELPKEAQVADCQFIFSTTTASYYISQIEFVGADAPKKTETTTTFGEGIDETKFTYVGDETPEGKTASVTPAKALDNGTLTYESSNPDIVTVDATTGALTFGEQYGTAKITATYAPAEGALFTTSTASYYVHHRRAADPKTIVFDSSEDEAFASINKGNQYSDGDVEFIDLNNDSYTFTVHNAMVNQYNGMLQLKKQSATNEENQGKITSPVFEKFEYGYRVTVKYDPGHGIELACLNYPEEYFDDVYSVDDENGTVYMDIPYYDGMFTIAGGDEVSYVKSIELTPLAKPKDPTTLAFPQAEYVVYDGEQSKFEGVKATLTNELGSTLDLPITYSIDNEDFALIDSNDGTVALGNTLGSAVITARFAGNDDYLPSETTCTLRLVEKLDAGIAYEQTEKEAELYDETEKNTSLVNPNNFALTYASSNEDVATVDEEGNVTLKAVGTTVITASFAGDATHKAAEASYTLNVKDSRQEAGLAFAEESLEVNIMKANEITGVELQNPNNLDVVYSSSNPEVAIVSATSQTITLLGEGETTITASFAGDRNFFAGSASYTLKVINEPITAIGGITADSLNETDRVYNLQGARVDVKHLNKGVYVVNGKKVVVK